MSATSPSHSLLLAGLAVFSLSTASAAPPLPIALSHQRNATNNDIELTWRAVPGRRYEVFGKTNLARPWDILVGQNAQSLVGAFSASVAKERMFYTVGLIDNGPPVVVSTRPSADAVAVGSNAPLAIALQDDSPIVASSIQLAVNNRSAIGVDDTRLVFSTNVITYTPESGESYGGAGETVSVTLSATDIHGNTLSNFSFGFQLALSALAKDFVAIGRRPGTLSPTAQGLSDADLTLVSVTDDELIFSYSDPPRINRGDVLVSFDPQRPYYRKALDVSNDASNSRLTIFTEDAALSGILTQGSLKSGGLIEHNGLVATQIGTDALTLSYGDSLQEVNLLNSPALQLSIKDGSWAFNGNADVTANIQDGALTHFNGEVDARLQFRLNLEAIAAQSVDTQGMVALIQPIRRLFGTTIGPVPVWIEAVFELDAVYSADADMVGSLSGGIEFEKEFVMNVSLLDAQWTHTAESSTALLKAIPVVWSADGSISVQVGLQPKLTIRALSLAGLSADLNPYLRLTGAFDQGTLEHGWHLYAGLQSELAMDIRAWDEDAWGPLPIWPLLSFEREILASRQIPSMQPPVIVTHPMAQTVSIGEAVELRVHALPADGVRYQWYHQALAIPLANGTVFQIASALLGHSGQYHVQASNGAGSAVSDSVSLTVTPGPINTSPPNVRISRFYVDSPLRLGARSTISVEFENLGGAGTFNYLLSLRDPSDAPGEYSTRIHHRADLQLLAGERRIASYTSRFNQEEGSYEVKAQAFSDSTTPSSGDPTGRLTDSQSRTFQVLRSGGNIDVSVNIASSGGVGNQLNGTIVIANTGTETAYGNAFYRIDWDDDFNFEIRSRHNLIESRGVRLNPGESRSFPLSLTPDRAGEWTINYWGYTDSFIDDDGYADGILTDNGFRRIRVD